MRPLDQSINALSILYGMSLLLCGQLVLMCILRDKCTSSPDDIGGALIIKKLVGVAVAQAEVLIS